MNYQALPISITFLHLTVESHSTEAKLQFLTEIVIFLEPKTYDW